MPMNPYLKDIFREIEATKSRFFSLLMISLLGAFVVVGIHATAIHMRDAADAKYRRVNLYDLQLRHPMGFTPEDVSTIRQTSSVEKVMPTNIVDVYVYVRDTRRTMRTYSLPIVPHALNMPNLLEGRLPNSPGEIAVERRLLREGGLYIGDDITLSHREMARFFSIFADETFTITGVVNSPLYLTNLRGNTTLGDGNLRYFAYLYQGAYIAPVYTDIYVIMQGSRDIHQVSDAYNTAALKWRSQMETILTDKNIGGFVFTRQNGIAFESYFQDIQRLESVGYVFPLIFFLVAVLVSLTTMTRMVEEQRGLIGVYKALGYKSAAIFLKYFLYALFSGLAGGILGTILGSSIVPRIIFNAYGYLYNMPPSSHPIPWGIAAIAVLSAVVSVTAAVLFTCIKTLGEEAASLMRPKAPPPGKRVLIEKIPAIWARLGFISKVTSRNIFRYKRRFFMTLAGVAGCTALLITAFGLGDSINSVPRLQFGEIAIYDAQVHTHELACAKGEADSQGYDVYNDARCSCMTEILSLIDDSASTLFVRTMTADAHTAAGGFSTTVIIPEDISLLPNFVNLISPSTGFLSARVEEITPTTHGVLVTEKLAREMNIIPGDYFTLTLGDGWSYTVLAAAIVENYLLHYVYMPLDYYASLLNRPFHPNGLLISGDTNLEVLRQHPLVLAITNTAWMRDNLRDQTDALSVVTIVLIVMACILALVVLFNLTSINMLERMRELATVKVLGFHDMETAMYLYRENIAVTVMGIALGLVAGVFLNGFILTTVEIDMLKFPHVILPVSFVMASGLSAGFALIVNVLTYRKIIAIDMVGALKSVE